MRPTDLRGILRYVPQFREKTFVIAADGAVVGDENFGNIVRGVDHLFTGRVERIDVELLQTLLSSGIVPVVPPLGMDGDGRTYRVNSDSVALEVAKALGAVKLVYITTEDGLLV